MSNNWTRKQKIGKNLTISTGSRRGPGFSSSMGNHGFRMTIQNRTQGTTVRITKTQGIGMKNVSTTKLSQSTFKPKKQKSFRNWLASTRSSPFR